MVRLWGAFARSDVVGGWLACGGLSSACRRPSYLSLLAQRDVTQRNGLWDPPTLQALAIEVFGTCVTLPVTRTATPRRHRQLRGRKSGRVWSSLALRCAAFSFPSRSGARRRIRPAGWLAGMPASSTPGQEALSANPRSHARTRRLAEPVGANAGCPSFGSVFSGKRENEPARRQADGTSVTIGGGPQAKASQQSDTTPIQVAQRA